MTVGELIDYLSDQININNSDITRDTPVFLELGILRGIAQQRIADPLFNDMHVVTFGDDANRAYVLYTGEELDDPDATACVVISGGAQLEIPPAL